MNTISPQTNFLQMGAIEQHDGYTLQDAGIVKLGKTSYKVEIQQIAARDDYPGGMITWFKGPRGAAYTLEPVSMMRPDGVFRLQSFRSGAYLRVQGNEVRVVMLGDAIEVL